MTRQLSFRAYDRANDRFVYARLTDTGFHILGDIPKADPLNPWQWQQHTGIANKNGMGIFEGDIVRYGIDGMRARVAWEAAKGRWHWSSWGLTVPEARKLTVIGNIDQNPDLLA